MVGMFIHTFSYFVRCYTLAHDVLYGPNAERQEAVTA